MSQSASLQRYKSIADTSAEDLALSTADQTSYGNAPLGRGGGKHKAAPETVRPNHNQLRAVKKFCSEPNCPERRCLADRNTANHAALATNKHLNPTTPPLQTTHT